MESSDKIVRNYMMENDAFSQWLGIEILNLRPGSVKLRMTVRVDMTNGFGVAHGGITYSLADSALAFAANSHGIKSVSIETSIQHLKPVHSGDVLVAEAIEESLSNKLAVYTIRVNREEELVALFKGMVYRTGKEW